MRNSTILTIASAGLATAAVISNNTAQAPTAATTDATGTAVINQGTNYIPRDSQEVTVFQNEEDSEEFDHVSTELPFHLMPTPTPFYFFFLLLLSMHHACISFLDSSGTGETTPAMQQQRPPPSSTVQGALLSLSSPHVASMHASLPSVFFSQSGA
jgi:hypothetical protein